MTLGLRKIILLMLIGSVFLMANIVLVANWLSEKGLPEFANHIRSNYLTGTAITVIDDYSYCTSLLNCSESSLKHVLNLKGFPFS